MNIFQKVIEDNVFFPTCAGTLNPSDVYRLPLGDEKTVWRSNEETLYKLGKTIRTAYEESGGDELLGDSTPKNEKLYTQYKFVLAAIKNRKRDRTREAKALALKKDNQMVADYLVERTAEELKKELDGMSIKDIKKKMMKK